MLNFQIIRTLSHQEGNIKFYTAVGILCITIASRIDHTKYQRDALNIIYSSNILLYMFRATSAHLQEEQLYVSSIWYRHSL